MTKTTAVWLSRLFGLITLTLVGCIPAGEEITHTPTTQIFATQANQTETSTPQSTLTTVPEAVTTQQALALTPSPTVTPLSSVTSMAATATRSSWQKTLTPIPGITALPTVVPKLRQQMYADLMATNGGCELPCWWGFELGQTTMTEVRQFYESFGATLWGRSVESQALTGLEFHLDDLGMEFPIEHAYFARHDLLETIYASADQDPSLQIEQLLGRIGQPKEVWLWTHPEPAFAGKITMELVLYYPDIGMVIQYVLTVARVEEHVVACFDQVGTVHLSIWLPEVRNPDGDQGLEAFLDGGYRVFTVEGRHPIEEVTNWDAEQFYSTLVDPDHVDCLETPAEIWPPRL